MVKTRFRLEISLGLRATYSTDSVKASMFTREDTFQSRMRSLTRSAHQTSRSRRMSAFLKAMVKVFRTGFVFDDWSPEVIRVNTTRDVPKVLDDNKLIEHTEVSFE